MGSWGYVALGFALTAAVLAAYALRLERRIAAIRSHLRSRGRR